MQSEAKKTSALFSPAQLTLARKARGYTKSRLAELSNLTPTSIAIFENSESKPSAETVARLAKALEFPIGFLSQEAAVFDDIAQDMKPFFRSLRKTTQMRQDEATARARLIYRLSQSFEEFVDFPTPDVPEFRVDENADRKAIESIAAKVRDNWGLGDEPIPNMVRLLESHGILVVRQKFNNTDLSAFSFRFGKRSMVLLGDDIDDTARSRFNAAHELGHLVMHHSECVGTSTVEKQANMFASAFLMPKQRFLKTFPLSLDWTSLGEMKRYWRVSMAAVLYRGHVLGKVSDASYRRILVKMSAMGWKKDEPMRLQGDEIPVILMKAAEAVQDDPDLYKRLIDRVCLPESLVSDLLSPRPQRRSLVLD